LHLTIISISAGHLLYPGKYTAVESTKEKILAWGSSYSDEKRQETWYLYKDSRSNKSCQVTIKQDSGFRV
jgi:hypothetical protein